MEAVGQLDEQDPGVLGHGDQHLAHGGGLLGLFRVEFEPVKLGDAVDDRGHLDAELGFDLGQPEPGVLDRVVQERGCDGHIVEAEPGQDGRNRQRVGDIGLA